MAQWRSRYCQVREGYFRASLRIMLQEQFSIRYWMEITAGRSWLAYRGLDLYVSYQCASSLPDPDEAWYLCNVEDPPLQRYDRLPEEWWHCKVHVSVGQRPRIQEWVLASRALVPAERL